MAPVGSGPAACLLLGAWSLPSRLLRRSSWCSLCLPPLGLRLRLRLRLVLLLRSLCRPMPAEAVAPPLTRRHASNCMGLRAVIEDQHIPLQLVA